jgi:hypothetical protein
MIAMAVEAEVKASMEQFEQITTPEGKAAMVRNGYLPKRFITTSAGPVSVQVTCPRLQDHWFLEILSFTNPEFFWCQTS